jgi:hypothetical protein
MELGHLRNFVAVAEATMGVPLASMHGVGVDWWV